MRADNMASVKAWKHGEAGAPTFPESFEIVKKAVLQVTDIKTNRNKYYAIELHRGEHKGKTCFRVYTHYGRTDDLETNPDAGQKECRYFDNLVEADANYQSIYREKTGPRKGYKELSLASSKIGSQQARGTSTGVVDDRTLAKIAPKEGEVTAPVVKKSDLHDGVQRLVRYIYDEATTALTSTVAAKITANGIETPLGILTIGQIEKGEKILTDMYDLFKHKAKNLPKELERLSGDFYTAIPHRIGRSRSAVATAVINTLEAFEQKQSTLQLMKDMLQVNGEGGNVLFNAKIDAEYEALKCNLGYVDHDSSTFRAIGEHVIKSLIKTKKVAIKNIFTLKRDGEWDGFTKEVGNERLLFHGSRIQNWVGILSRGILLPKIVVSLGVNRTDAGWLGNGIYFGDAACTSLFYTTPGKEKTRLITVARVALGKIKDYTKITYGLAAPPAGHDSCHGVRRQAGVPSEFDDDEYVIYQTPQQRLEYLVEIAA
jgi:poly [ADP-ribose] polymerase